MGSCSRIITAGPPFLMGDLLVGSEGGWKLEVEMEGRLVGRWTCSHACVITHG